MKRPTPDEIAEMKAKGYCASTIADAEARLARSAEADRVIDIIADAFSGVTLGSGVGLSQARTLDDHENEATCAARRAKDEKDDWRRITAEPLNIYHDCRSFFDAEGMRFHLPAYLIAELRGEYRFDLVICLSYLSDHSISQFALLSTQQRQAVRAYLLHIISDPDNKFDKPHIVRSLEAYWVEPEETKTG